MTLTHRSALSLLAAAAALVAAPPAPSAARPSYPVPAVRPVEIPDSPAGRVAKAFLATVNDPSEKAVAAFESTHGSTKRRGSVELSDRVLRLTEMKKQWGSFTAERIVTGAENSLTLGVRVASGEILEMEFQLSAAEPGKLDAVMIASGGPAAKPESVTKAQVAEIVESAASKLEEAYVFPDVARKMGESVRGKLAAGEYDSIKDEAELARRLTDDFRAISHDKHLRVSFNPKQPSEAPHMGGPNRHQARRENYGFRKVELLPGNIGYLRFDFFMEENGAKQVATSALAFLANADALIFDMRSNGGGSPDMIRYITTYLFDQRTHLNDMIDRDGKTVEEYWTLDEVPGQRFAPDLPVYVLTSSRTFSGAEEFSYNLKNLKRATIIGDTTGGGAHPVMGERLSDRFVIGVPFMRANNPISKTNWEGTGVEPDIKVPAAEALERATKEAQQAIEARRASSPAK